MPPSWNRSPLRIAALIILHSAVLGAVVQLFAMGVLGKPFTWASTLHFDALHYQWIAEHGYVSFRQAFFPMFPAIWHLLSTSTAAICVLNYSLYVGGLTWLCWSLSISTKTLVVFLLLPGAVFFAIPYTESLFFLFACMTLVGIQRDSYKLLCAGLVGCTLTRPAFTTLVPAILFAIWLKQGITWTSVYRSVAVAIASSLGLLAVLVIQHHYTGEWFGFYKAQSGWGNQLAWPTLPLGSWGGDDVVKLDAVALLVGISAGCACVIVVYKRISEKVLTKDAATIVAWCAIASVCALTIAIRGGSLFSLNRFVFATPFALLFIHSTRNLTADRSMLKWGLFFALLLLYFLLFGAYVHIQHFLSFMLLGGFLLLAIRSVMATTSIGSWWFRSYVAIAFSIQVYFSFKVLAGEWVA